MTKLMVVNKNLNLVEFEVKNDTYKKVKSGVNHIFIYDRSGSMYGNLERLCADMKKRFSNLSPDDTLTLAWFSGEGQYNYILKGFRISNDADRKKLEKVVDDNSATVGMTCFSEVLAQTKQVVKDLSIFNKSFALTFFTDGYPVVSNYSSELSAINKAIDDVAGDITSALFVGYGDYYNKELMASMAGKMGGSLVHSNDLAKFSLDYERFIDSARGADRVLIDAPVKNPVGNIVFTIDKDAVVAYELNRGQAMVRGSSDDTIKVYAITEDMKAAGKYTETVFSDEVLYAAALVSVQRAKTDVAIDLLGHLGDIGLVNSASSAFTNEEFGKVENGLAEAIKYPKRRFLAGKKVGCIPDRDAYCVLNALETIMSDGEAEFMPYDGLFVYKRVGRQAKPQPGYPVFEPDRKSRVPMTALVWNDTRLNLSVRAKIGGTVDLGTGAEKVGLDRKHETFIWRNYTIIKDGVLNVSKLPVSLSKKTYNEFLDAGIVDKEHDRHYAGRVYIVHLDRLPIMNRRIAEDNTSATKLVKWAAKELELEANQKVLNSLIASLEVEKQIGGYTQEQSDFLKSRGVTAGGFNPPVDKEDAVDFYIAKEFAIKAAGFSSLPKLSDVQEKVAKKKKLTASNQLVNEAYTDIANKLGLSGKLPTVKHLDKLKNELDDVRKHLTETRSHIQKAKFAVVLGNKWFSEFTSRVNCELTSKVGNLPDEVTFKFDLSETRVEI